MLSWLIDIMVFAGAALMVYNICGFLRFARSMRRLKGWQTRHAVLYVPVVLLIFFFLGYVVVGLFGKPDLMTAAILFFGSIFVFIMYHLLRVITGRTIESEHLEARLMAAEEASRAKSSFLAGVSHEMRTPMNVILGLSAVAQKNPALPAETRTQLEKIELSARHLLGLVNNVLDLNRIESGALETRQESFSLPELLGEIDAMTQTLCEHKGLTYESDAEDTACALLGDAVQLRRVLMSVLDNAIKYTNAPGSVRFSARSDGEADGVRTLRFTVTDTGVGIAPDFLPRIFEPFSQEGNSTTSRFGGIGLSLSVAKRILELWGGTIRVESEKHVGTVVTILLSLPLVGRAEPETEPETETALESLEGCRILIVEDIDENAEIVADLLELEDAESERAENGQIALDMLTARPEDYYDAVLMDLRMPVMGGLECAQHIRQLERADLRALPIIALTANAFESDVRASLEAGMNVHLAKPTDADKLYETLKRCIGTARARKTPSP